MTTHWWSSKQLGLHDSPTPLSRTPMAEDMNPGQPRRAPSSALRTLGSLPLRLSAILTTPVSSIPGGHCSALASIEEWIVGHSGDYWLATFSSEMCGLSEQLQDVAIFTFLFHFGKKKKDPTLRNISWVICMPCNLNEFMFRSWITISKLIFLLAQPCGTMHSVKPWGWNITEPYCCVWI